MQIKNKTYLKDYLFAAVLYAIDEDQIIPGDAFLLKTTLRIEISTKEAARKLKRWKKELENGY